MKRNSEIRSLNSVRGLAALIVLISHYSNQTKLFGGLLGQGAGQIGVMLFFLLSAFLITVLYSDRKFNIRNVRNFLGARVARVMPLFVIVVMLTYVATKFLGVAMDAYPYQIGNWKQLTAVLTLTQGGPGVLWTIPPEVHFYLLFVMFWLGKFKFPKVSVACIAGLVGVGLWFPISGSPLIFVGDVYFEFKITQLYAYFLIGILLGMLYKRWSPPSRFRNHLFALSPILLPVSFPRVQAILLGREGQGDPVEPWTDFLTFVLVVGVFVLILFFVPDQNILLENRFGDFIGRISYSTYLLHLPLLALVTSAGLTGVKGLGIFIVGTYVISSISFRMVEDPLRSKLRFHLQARNGEEPDRGRLGRADDVRKMGG